MSFTRDDVQALARLARLALTDEEVALFARQLSEIVDYAHQVTAITTPPAGIGSTLTSPLRDDALLPSLPREEVLAAAPDADAATGLIKVPRVLG